MQTANSLSMHYIAVRTDCNVVHPEAICSLCLVFICTLLFLSFCYAPKRPSPFLLYIPHKKPLFMIKYELPSSCCWCFLS